MIEEYLIMTTSYNGPRKFLMSSKKKTFPVQKYLKWTRLLDLAAVFRDEQYAEQVALRFSYGNPQVVTMEQAEQYMGEDEELDDIPYVESAQ